MIDYTIREFRPETDILKPFDCGNSDLNGFFVGDRNQRAQRHSF